MTINELKRQFLCLQSEALPYHWLERWLLSVLNQDKAFMIAYGDYVLSEKELGRLNAGIEQMKQGVPLAYVMGHQGFFGHEFLVNEHTLIPRPDSELLVQTVLDFVKDRQAGRILDLGTGSGCIAISLAKALPDWLIMGVDKSAQATMMASQNAYRLGAKNITIVQSDWFSSVAGKWHVIVSNPPYIAKDDEHLEALSAEPISALVADENGLADIRWIIEQAGAYLHDGGMLALEHGHTQAHQVQDLLKQAGFKEVMTLQDYGANDRVTWGVWYAQ